MEMYRIVFKGELLDGFKMQDVQMAIGQRLRLGADQLASMFGGQLVVLKKGVTADTSQPYLAELWRLGMNVWLEPLATVDEAATASATFKVVFWGKVVQGYGRSDVMRAAGARLGVDQNQILRLFSGAKSVLKRGVTAELGVRYVAELARIGMQIELEVETESLPPPNLTATQVMAGQTATSVRNNINAPDDYSFTQILTTQIDLQRGSDNYYPNAANSPEKAPTPPPPPLVRPPIRPAPLPASASIPPTRQAREQAGQAVLAAVLAAERAEPAVQVRCHQCGRRQAPAKKCVSCGCEMKEIPPAEETEFVPPPPKKDKRPIVSDPNAAPNYLPTLMREMIDQTPQPRIGVFDRYGPEIVIGASVLAVFGFLAWIFWA